MPKSNIIELDDLRDSKLKIGPFNDDGLMPLTLTATRRDTGEPIGMTLWLDRAQLNAFISALTERLGN